MALYPKNPVYAAAPAEIIKSIHDDAQQQVNSLYKTVDKLNAVQWAFDKDKKKLMHALCPPCKDKIQSNCVHVITYVEVGSQTGKSLESGMHEHKRTIELLEQKLEAERMQTDQLKTELRIKDGEIHLLQTERDQLTMCCETLRGEDAMQKKTNEQMTKLQRENEDILSNLKSLQNAVCKQHVEELNTLKDKMVAELEALRGEKESVGKDLMEQRTKVNYQNAKIGRLSLELRNQHSIMTESDTMLKDLKEQISKLKEDIECMASKKELLEHVIGIKDRELMSLKSDKDKLAFDLQELQNDKTSMQRDMKEQMAKLGEQKEALGTKDEALKKLQTDMDTLKQDKNTMYTELSAKEKTVESLTMEMNALKRDQQSLKKNHDMTCKDLNEEIANLEEEISDVSSKRDMLQNDICAKDEELLLLKNHQIKKEKDLELLNKEKFAMQKDLADQMTNHNIEMADKSSAMEYLQKQIRAKTEEFSWLKTEKCNLSKDLESLKKEKDAMEKDLNKQMTNLRNKLADQTSKVEDLQSTMRTRDEELKLLRLDKYSLRQDQETLQTQEDSTEKDLNEQLRKLKVEIADQESKMKELRNTNYEKDEALKNLQMDKETLSRDQETLKTEMEMMTKDHNVQITKLKEELEDMSTQLDVPRHEMYEKDEALKNLQMDKETLSRDQETLKTEMEMMTKDHNVQIAKLKEELEDMSTQLDVPRHEMYQKEEDIKKLQEKIETLQSKGKKVVGLGLCGSSGIGKAMLDMVTKELRRRLIGTLESDDISLTIQPCLKTSEIPKGPIAVICLNMSSIGTTMREALKCVEADKDVIVLVLHHTGKENLPSLTPTHLRVVGREYRSLRGIFDMAFTSESGMYDCDVNNSSVEKMLAILRKY